MTLWPFLKECRAIAAISLETVAEKNNVWRSFGRWSMMNLRSSEKPISRSVSASSSTSISVLASASFTRGSEIRSLNRPGVATTTSLDCLENSFNCLSRLSPPTNEWTLKSLCQVQSFPASTAIWVASSRVGEMIKAPTWEREMARWLRPWACLSGMVPSGLGALERRSRVFIRASIAGTKNAYTMLAQ